MNEFYSFVLAVLSQEEDLSQEEKLCADKSAGELFRLKAGEDSCRDVIQCTAAVSQVFFAVFDSYHIF